MRGLKSHTYKDSTFGGRKTCHQCEGLGRPCSVQEQDTSSETVITDAAGAAHLALRERESLTRLRVQTGVVNLETFTSLLKMSE